MVFVVAVCVSRVVEVRSDLKGEFSGCRVDVERSTVFVVATAWSSKSIRDGEHDGVAIGVFTVCVDNHRVAFNDVDHLILIDVREER